MINIKLSKKIIQIFTITSIISLFQINSYAYDGDITIDQSFTYEDGYWKPGRIESKNFYINNNKENDISIDRLYMSLKSSEYWKTGEELDINSNKFKEFARYSTVILKHNNNVLFEDTFENLLSEDGIKLSKDIDIKSNDKELLNMTIDMDLEMDNDAQALNNVFTIGVAYKMEENLDTDEGENDNEESPGDLPQSPDNPDVETDEGENGNENDENSGYLPIIPDINISGDILNKLPQTGGIINSFSLISLGAVVIGTGIALNRKSDKKGGGKHNE